MKRSHRLVPPKLRRPVRVHTPRRGPRFWPFADGVGPSGLPNMKLSVPASVPSLWNLMSAVNDPNDPGGFPRVVVQTHVPAG